MNWSHVFGTFVLFHIDSLYLFMYLCKYDRISYRDISTVIFQRDDCLTIKQNMPEHTALI